MSEKLMAGLRDRWNEVKDTVSDRYELHTVIEGEGGNLICRLMSKKNGAWLVEVMQSSFNTLLVYYGRDNAYVFTTSGFRPLNLFHTDFDSLNWQYVNEKRDNPDATRTTDDDIVNECLLEFLTEQLDYYEPDSKEYGLIQEVIDDDWCRPEGDVTDVATAKYVFYGFMQEHLDFIELEGDIRLWELKEEYLWSCFYLCVVNKLLNQSKTKER